MKLTRLAATVVLADVAATVLFVAPATASDRICRGSIGAVTIGDNVQVPVGATCNLTRTYVKGNVLVSRNATLVATRVRVDGNVQAQRAKRVVVRASSMIDGDVQAGRGRAVSVLASAIDGNIQLKANAGPIRVGNRVNGDIQLFSNHRRSEERPGADRRRERRERQQGRPVQQALRAPSPSTTRAPANRRALSTQRCDTSPASSR